MHARQKIGSHEVWHEPETGIIVVTQVGTITGPEATQMTELFATYAKDSGGAPFVIGDGRRATGQTKEARNAFGTSGILRNDFHLATFGQPFAYRVVIVLFARALAAPGSKVVL